MPLPAEYNIDKDRVYVTGASNGAMMSLRLGCELAHKITAIAPVIGSMPENLVAQCAPARPMPLMMINGTDDPLVPWEGGYVHIFRKKLGKIISVPQTIDFWVARNGCSPIRKLAGAPTPTLKTARVFKKASIGNAPMVPMLSCMRLKAAVTPGRAAINICPSF